MKTTLRLFLFLAALNVLLAKAEAQSQGAMNQQAYADFKKADAALNRIYAQVLAKLDEEGQTKLKTAQRAWVVFRDAQAEVDADEMRGGSAARGLRAASLTEATRQRTQELKALLKFLKVSP